MQETSSTFNSSRYNSAFAVRFRELVNSSEDIKNIAGFLGISPQAVNQFKLGQAFPKVENLLKLAAYFGCSLDYLIGMSDVKTPLATVKAACEYTGLSEDSVNMLHGSTRNILKGKATVSHIPIQERQVIDALLTTVTGMEILKDLYSFLFNNYDVFIMHGKDKDGKDATLQSDTITMHGSDLPVYVVHPDDVRDMIARKIYRNLSELQREVDKMEGE